MIYSLVRTPNNRANYLTMTIIIETIAVAFALLAALSIVWSTVRTGIPPMMSNASARSAMLKQINCSDGDIIDLGSGWGTLLMAAAKQHPQRQIIGYEVSWLPWLYARLRLAKYPNVRVYRQDFRHASLASASILLCYLMPKGMQTLAGLLAQYPDQQITIISNNFSLPALSATKTLQLNDLYKSPIYVYQWPS
ncbi:class I SAM-dependent methyltransferase [Salinibius halmophilus]|uniref:class I SAM-dependent methyltransferase n=1 Tax=Salinibius halmophilus TaxID=1853216 RepID=UPI0018F2EB9C|nr:class I SAM-dependent methyltransferase [Salinibius halmophilus]